ncbi:hypothetical protein [Gimesia algae]|uniref:Uncharacterized protein n=1 Tax=Gimesia algae TaxID=2527971 RepID=A0A517VA36_9PLAN|nr:hypothetical protein [Gimesia algae]QDT89863.1 hypothetical protein Pan161_14960 [Gimesia algae]
MTTAIQLHQLRQFEGRCKLASVKRPKDVSQETSGFLGHLYCPFYYSIEATPNRRIEVVSELPVPEYSRTPFLRTFRAIPENVKWVVFRINYEKI